MLFRTHRAKSYSYHISRFCYVPPSPIIDIGAIILWEGFHYINNFRNAPSKEGLFQRRVEICVIIWRNWSIGIHIHRIWYKRVISDQAKTLWWVEAAAAEQDLWSSPSSAHFIDQAGELNSSVFVVTGLSLNTKYSSSWLYLQVRPGGKALESPCLWRWHSKCRHSQLWTLWPWGSRHSPSNWVSARWWSGAGRRCSPAVRDKVRKAES